MKKRITFLTAAFALLAFLVIPLGMRGQQVVSGTTYSTPSVSGLPEGWSGEDGGGTSYIKLIAADHYIQTANFEQNGFTSITIKARKYGGPSAAQAKIYVSWYDSENEETVLGTIDPTNTTLTNYTISNPATTENGTGYIKIQNKEASSSKGSGVSEVTITYVVPGGTQPTTYTVTYNANVTGTSPIVDTYNEGADVTLRPATTFTNEGYTFDEWNTQADGDGDSYAAGDVIENIQANIELFAIWTANPPSDEQWVLTDLTDLTTNDVFVIVGNNGSNYAMSNNNGTGSAPAAVAVTVANDAITSNVADNIQWTISGNANDGYTFYPNGSTETWLYCTNTNNGVRVGTNGDNTFKIESGYLMHQGTSRYVGVYNSSDWRCYTSINNNIQGQTFAFYKKVTGGALPPSITANNVEISYETTSGSISYTINNEPDPAGTISAVVTDGDWLTLGQNLSFTCSVNEAATDRTATVLLTYTYGNNQTVTKNVTVTQLGNPNVTPTIAEVRAQGTGNVVTRGVVTSITGSNNKTAYIQDATAAIVVYGDFTAAVGDEIRVSGTLQDYNGLLEITSPTVTVLTSGNTINPELMTIAEAVASPNQGWYIRIENAIVTAISGQNTTIAQGENTIVVRGISGVEIEVDDVISLNGNIGYYNGNQIANPQNVEVQQSTNPSITIDPATLNVDAQQHLVNYFSLTYENIVVENTQSFTVHYYNAEGQEIQPAQGEMWMIAGVAKLEAVYQVLCTIIANEGDARTAYFKVSAQDADNNTIYSNLVTVNQEAYVELENYAVFTGNLIEGDYLIVYNDHAMNNVVSSDRLQYENVEAVNDVISTNNASIIWHIAPSGDYWTIYSADANAYAASTGAKNKAQMLADGTDDKALWTVEGMETFEFVNKANTEAGVNANLRNNGTYGFACYSTSTGGALTLYKKVTSTATYTLNITGYGNNEGGYYLIASPIYGLNPANVEGMTDGDFDLYYYDQTQVGQEWRNYKAGAFQYLTPGKGYLYAHKTDTNLTFTGMPYEGDGVVTLNAGCNLVGNPFGQVAYINKPFYTLNAEGSELISDPIGGAINPMEGVFVVADTDGENLTFNTTQSSNSNGRVIMNVYSSRANVIDRAIVRFDENTTLPKFQLNPNSTKLYIPQDDVDYAVIYSQANGEIPVSFKAATNGTYTLNVNTTNIEMDYLHLIDNMTGEDVDLLANPNYTFNARTSDYAQRFRLVFGTDSVNENNAETFAYFNGNEWQISNVGEATLQVVDVMGRLLKSETVNGNATISTNGLCAGVYMMRLVNGNDVKVQKIVVR